MANRKRNIQMKFYVTEDEKRLIDEKMSQLPTRRYGSYKDTSYQVNAESSHRLYACLVRSNQPPVASLG